jgi:hypothetical protein
VLGSGNYSICLEFSGNGVTEIVCGEFLNGTHDYQLKQVIFTPKNPIQNATFIIQFSQSGTAYFYGMSAQEQVPGNHGYPFFLLFPETPNNPFNCIAPLAYDPNWESKGTAPCALVIYNKICKNKRIFSLALLMKYGTTLQF